MKFTCRWTDTWVRSESWDSRLKKLKKNWANISRALDQRATVASNSLPSQIRRTITCNKRSGVLMDLGLNKTGAGATPYPRGPRRRSYCNNRQASHSMVLVSHLKAGWIRWINKFSRIIACMCPNSLTSNLISRRTWTSNTGSSSPG